MKIQLVTYDHSNNGFGEAVTEVNTFNSARVLDDFDINLIDLTDKNIWYNEDYNYNKVNCERDLQSLDALILNSQKSAILVLLPCNQEMHYKRNINGGYAKKLQLKDMLGILSDTILTGAFHTQSSFVFGISYTDINNLRLKSDFFFAIEDPNNIQSATKTESGNIHKFQVQLEQ